MIVGTGAIQVVLLHIPYMDRKGTMKPCCLEILEELAAPIYLTTGIPMIKCILVALMQQWACSSNSCDKFHCG